MDGTKGIRTGALASLLALTVAAASAQGGGGPGPGPGGGMGPGMGPGPAASAPGMGMGPGRMGRWGQDVTPGWSLMTEQERLQHQERMRSMKSYEECQTYMAQHRTQMAERAKARGTQLPTPRHDACGGLKP